MSGGVGPSGDIKLPREEEETYKPLVKDGRGDGTQKPQQSRALFTFQQLNALAVIVVLSSSGMVSIEDFAFVVFSLIYMYFMSRVAFPSLSPHADPPVFGQKNRVLTLYVFIGALVGLLLPIAYIFEGIFEGDKEGIKAAAPHVFLLASQVFMEGVSFSGRFSLPIRVFVPVFFNSRRIFTIVEWLRSEIYKADMEYGGNIRRLHVGRALAVANMAFWCFNLFGFLLPFYLPKAFKLYYSSSGNKANDQKSN
ncbi:OLC1v1027449C1 [Oldenlandia corymbosa var. corymbosa]|uniref:OLC1v1027449C1 n=1 Tax=Oldenlandia corymbosa var. corymbosa TaxID=529605 RepID=A0AAV1CA96_OLDCO|nr:OLC1v1027449C1 [Oldenlandia corymbosa var. corymbosa]